MHSEHIVALEHTPTLYTDKKFFQERMNEDPKHLSIPCKIVGLKIGWILKKPEGKQFLINILNAENMELFEIKPI